MEVYTTNYFALMVIYTPNRSYDINTSNYKKITTNKDAKVIELYDDLEDYVLKNDRKIIRNYLVKEYPLSIDVEFWK